MIMMAPVRAIVERPFRISLLAGPAAAAQARRHVRAVIGAWDVPVDDYTAAQLRVEVHDGSRCAPAPVHALPYAEAGRGLMLLDSMSSGWGYRETARGKAVYYILTP